MFDTTVGGGSSLQVSVGQELLQVIQGTWNAIQSLFTLGTIEVIASTVLAAFTIVLAQATRKYTRQSEEQTEEMGKSRAESIRPVIKPAIVSRTGLHYFLVLRNTGKGAAHDVSANWGFDHLEKGFDWKTGVISAGSKHIFALPFDENSEMFMTAEEIKDALKGSDGQLSFEARYTDPMGRGYETREDIDVTDAVGQGAGFEVTQRDNLKQIAKEMKKHRKETRKLRRETKKQRQGIQEMSGQLADQKADRDGTKTEEEDVETTLDETMNGRQHSQ